MSLEVHTMMLCLRSKN